MKRRREDKWCGETRSAESIYIDRSVPLNKDPTRRTAAEDRKRRRGATKGGEPRSNRRRAEKGTNQSQLDLSVTMQMREREREREPRVIYVHILQVVSPTSNAEAMLLIQVEHRSFECYRYPSGQDNDTNVVLWMIVQIN